MSAVGLDYLLPLRFQRSKVYRQGEGFGQRDILFGVYSSDSIKSFFKESFGDKITLNTFSCRTYTSLNSPKKNQGIS